MKKVIFLTLLLALSFGFIQAQLLCSSTITSTPGANGVVDFTATGSSGTGNAYYYSFDYGDGSNGANNTGIISHTYTSAGVYLACVTVIFTDSCMSTSCDSFYTAGSGGGGFCTASMSIPSGSNGVINFTASGNSGTGTPVYYSYSFGDGSAGGSANGAITHTYTNAGVYYPCVTVIFSDSCTATACDSFYTAGSGGGGGGCQASYYWYPDSTGQYSIIIQDQSTGTGLSYLWDFGDNTTSTSPNPSHVYSGPGTYIVCVTVSSSNPACTSTYCDSLVVVNKVSSPFSINVLSNNALAVDPRGEQSTDVSLYPNPARDIMNVKIGIAQDAEVSVRLMELSGKLVATQNAGLLSSGQHNLRIATQDLPAGMYLARVQVGETSSVRKVMIAH